MLNIPTIFTIHLLVSKVNRDGPDQTAQMCRLIWAFPVHIWPKTPFPMVLVIYSADGQRRLLSDSMDVQVGLIQTKNVRKVAATKIVQTFK